jgi:hypothetical protein
MRLRELFRPKILVALTNEEVHFLKNNKGQIDLHSLSERDQRVAQNLIIKDILCKISDTQLKVNENVPPTS